MAAPLRCTGRRAAGVSITSRTDYPEKNNENWFCHTILTKQDGRMTSEKRAVQPYVVPIAEDEKDLYDKQRMRLSR